MSTVNSVTGPLDTGQLDFTLMHEHMCSSSAGLWTVWPELFGNRAAFADGVVGRLREARKEGVRTIVDVTTFDMGRDIRLLYELAHRSEMQIIACTGHWRDISRSIAVRTVDELTGLFVKEIEHGIEGTEIKAGIIKVANDAEGVTEQGARILRAAARAHLATGLPIITHQHAGSRIGDLQADIFEEEGVKPNRVSIGHSDDTTNVNYLLGLLRRGFYLAMDRLPLGLFSDRPPDWQTRVSTIKRLIDEGFAHKLLLSHDYSLGMSLWPTKLMPAFWEANPDHILFISRKVLPRLREMGVTNETIHELMVNNPRRFFEGAGLD